MKIGIDIGGSHIAAGIVEDKGNLLDKETRDINGVTIQNQEQAEKLILNIIDEEIKILLEKNRLDITNISKLGLAVPGSPSKTAIRNTVNLHIENFEIAEELEKRYNVNVTLKNDGKCAGYAEKTYGALKEYDDCIFLCIGTGVGSAVFINGQLLEPQQNPGFEFGHMIIDKNGNQCNCGNKGCFETYASMKRLKKTVIEKLNLENNIESEKMQKYIRDNINQINVANIINEYIDNLSIGIANIINIFEPKAICFGGSFSYYADIFLPLLKEKLKKYIFNKDTKFDLVCAQLKNDAGIIGATEFD